VLVGVLVAGLLVGVGALWIRRNWVLPVAEVVMPILQVPEFVIQGEVVPNTVREVDATWPTTILNLLKTSADPSGIWQLRYPTGYFLVVTRQRLVHVVVQATHREGLESQDGRTVSGDTFDVLRIGLSSLIDHGESMNRSVGVSLWLVLLLEAYHTEVTSVQAEQLPDYGIALID
jgi:hypothetical protein